MRKIQKFQTEQGEITIREVHGALVAGLFQAAVKDDFSVDIPGFWLTGAELPPEFADTVEFPPDVGLQYLTASEAEELNRIYMEVNEAFFRISRARLEWAVKSPPPVPDDSGDSPET